jgi:probable HAF family extracellular repeat protein
MIKHRLVRTSVAVAAGMAIGLAATAIPALADSSAPASYSFRRLDNGNDGTYNELLGINNHGKIAGFYGSGSHGDPNQGYLLTSPYGQGSYHAENFPGSAQTVVADVNDSGVTVGYFSRTNKASGVNGYNGFYLKDSVYHKVAFTTGNNSSPAVNQLTGINDAGIAVGYFVDSLGDSHAYRYNIGTHKFSRLNVQGSSNVTATGINAGGAIVGYFTNASGKVVAFLRRPSGQVVTFARPGAVATQAFGINKGGVAVGAYTIGGDTYGFTWQAGRGFRTVNDPNGVGSTVVNGINNAGDLVGFYIDAQGNTDGMLATP